MTEKDESAALSERVAEFLNCDCEGPVTGLSGLNSQWLGQFNQLSNSHRQQTMLALKQEAEAVHARLQTISGQVAAEAMATLFEFMAGPLRSSNALFVKAQKLVDAELGKSPDDPITETQELQRNPDMPLRATGRRPIAKMRLLRKYKEAERIHLENVKGCAELVFKASAAAGKNPVNAIQINNNPQGPPPDTRTPYQKMVQGAVTGAPATPDTDPTGQ